MPARSKKTPRAPFIRVSREFTFDAAHRLLEYKGKCEALHGHTYRMLVTLEARVGGDGLAFDFCELKRVVEERCIEKLDHAYLNEVVRQPTAENIAIWAWDRLADLPLSEIKVWETPSASVSYTGGGRK